MEVTRTAGAIIDFIYAGRVRVSILPIPIPVIRVDGVEPPVVPLRAGVRPFQQGCRRVIVHLDGVHRAHRIANIAIQAEYMISPVIIVHDCHTVMPGQQS